MNELIKMDRLKNIISSDRQENPLKIEKLLKAEMLNLLKNYFDISQDDLSLSILINKDGRYDIQINFVSNKCIIANVFA